MVFSVFDVKRTPVHMGRFEYQSHLNHHEDSPPEPTSTYIPDPYPLGQKSFTHLSIWAHLAIAFILLAVATVFAYLVYTSYHSGKSRHRGNGAPWKRVPGIGGDGRETRMCDKVSDVVNLGGIRAGRAVLDLKVFGFGHHRKQSEIETKMIRLSRPTASKTLPATRPCQGGICDLHPILFASLTAITNDGVVQATNRKTDVPWAMLSGFSLSPNPFYLVAPTDHWDSVPRIEIPTISSRAASNLIRTTSNMPPPLNPFMTPPTGILWNDPKLSPIHGSIITCSPNVNGGLSTPERSSSTRGASLTSTLSRHFSKAPEGSSPDSSRSA